MRSREPGIVVAAALLALTGLASPASGATDSCTGKSDIRDGGGEAVGECPGNTEDQQPVVDGGDGGDGLECTPERAADPDEWWISYDIPDESIPGTDGDRQQLHATDPPEGKTLGIYRDCNGDPRGSLLWVPEPEPGGEGDVDGIFAARELARARLQPAAPVPNVSPAEAVVNFPTWLWIDEGYWESAVASESTPGGASVTVEARPVRAVWDMFEGERVCEGPGVAWSQEAQDAYEAQPADARGHGNPACTFEFVHSSTTQPDGVYPVSVTVVWEFSWSLNGVDQGPIGTVEVSDDWELVVGEIQTLITG